MTRSLCLPALLAMALSLQGCATLRGSQDPLAELRPAAAAVSMTEALNNFSSSDASKRAGLTKRDYRDVVIREYSQRIEGKYNAFVDQLYSGDRSTALAFDLAQLGLAAATGLVAQSAVDELSAASTVAAGARASIDKRVFYDRTIGALIASMDAERATVLADIARKRRLPAAEYSLNDAFDDLNRLANAGNVNRAFGRLNKVAEADRAAAQARLDGIPAACEGIEAEDAALRRNFRLYLDAAPNNVTTAAKQMELDLPAGQDAKAFLRNAFASNYCGTAPKQELLEKLSSGG